MVFTDLDYLFEQIHNADMVTCDGKAAQAWPSYVTKEDELIADKLVFLFEDESTISFKRDKNEFVQVWFDIINLIDNNGQERSVRLFKVMNLNIQLLNK